MSEFSRYGGTLNLWRWELIRSIFNLLLNWLNWKCTLISVIPCNLEQFGIFVDYHMKIMTCTDLPKIIKWHDVCTGNEELCDAGVLILFLFVMCSFSCWLVIQSLGVSATSTMFWSLQSMWIKHMFQIFCFTTQWTTWKLILLVYYCSLFQEPTQRNLQPLTCLRSQTTCLQLTLT